jgi:threonine synthase
VKGIQLLAETEGIFAETAGGVTTGVTKKLIEQGYIGPNETTVVCITGNGLKTIDAVSQEYSLTAAIAPRLTEFEAFINDRMVVAAAK